MRKVLIRANFSKDKNTLDRWPMFTREVTPREITLITFANINVSKWIFVWKIMIYEDGKWN